MAWVGAITCFLAGSAATVQLELKKVLAYSTISQIGYMFLGLGVGAPSAAIFFVIMHAFFKASLFLGAGSVMESNADNQDMRVMGAFRKYMPITALGFMAAWLSISGIFPFGGFWSKDDVLESAFFAGGWSNKAVWAIGTASIFLTAFYMTRQVWMVYFGNERFRKGVPVVSGGSDDDAPVDTEDPPVEPQDLAAEVAVDLLMPVDPEPQLDGPPKERTLVMTVPLAVLAFLATIGGIINLPFKSFENLDKWLEPVSPSTPPIHAPSFLAGFSLSMFALAIAVTSIFVARAIYQRGLPGHTDILPEKLGRLGVVLANAFYLDRLVSWFVRRPGRWFADELAGPVDQVGIDGAVNGIGRFFTWASHKVRLVQTGAVRNYALAVLIGAAVILAYMVWRVF
ncbi:MAG: proton-conducting transporter membrane subunit [Acidimicrobiia bacterium]|nr:proton-conducting transporter membrane subunit [Acidimicrobiia bacterium]